MHTSPSEAPHRGWEVRLFGTLRVGRDGTRLALRGRERRVVAALALHGPATRGELAGTLWPEVSEERARTNVRSALWTLGRSAPGLLECDGVELALAPTVRVDAADLLATWQVVVGRRRHADHDRHPDAGEAPDGVDEPSDGPLPTAELLTGGRCTQPLLIDWTEDWVVVERERFEQLRLHLLDALCTRAAARGDLALAEMLALQAVAADPLRESAQRRLMQVYLTTGDVAAALAVHRGFRGLLARELGLSPTPMMDALLGEALGGDPAAPRRSRTGRGAGRDLTGPRRPGAGSAGHAAPIRDLPSGTLSISHRDGIPSTAWP